MLVLRRGNDGYESAHDQSGVGFQRHGTPGRGVSGKRSRDARAERFARVRHLRTRSAGSGRHHDSARRAGKDFAFCPRGGSGCHHARKIVPANRLGNDGHRGLDYKPRVFRRVSRHACGKRRRSGNYPPNGEGHLRRKRVSKSLEMGERKMQA